MNINVLRNDELDCLIVVFNGSPGSFHEVKEIVDKLELITTALGGKRYLILNFTSMDLDSEFLKYFFENLKWYVYKNVIDWCTVSEKSTEDYTSKVFHYSMKQVRPMFRTVELAQGWIRQLINEGKEKTHATKQSRKTDKTGDTQ